MKTKKETGILVTKASGEQAEFSEEKLRHSLEYAGASEENINDILVKIENELYEGISTKKIYKTAFDLLKKASGPYAAKYKLKKAIMELGPSGYPFENFIGEVLKYQGFKTRVGVMVKGHCVTHEVDVVAEKGDKHYIVECKFHNRPGYQCDVKIPLYINSRFKDIEEERRKNPDHSEIFHQGWLVTNTKFSKDAVQYGLCAGLFLLGWDFPKKGSLKDRIDISGLHPITSLTTITKGEKQLLLENKIVLCRDILHDEKKLFQAHIQENRFKKILKEAEEVCSPCQKD